MTNEEIIKSNKLIADFMGAEHKETALPLTSERLGNTKIWLPIHGIVDYTTIDIGRGRILEYHKSWDWLMSVVEKIRSTTLEGYNYQIKIDDEKGYVFIIHPLVDNSYIIQVPIEPDLKAAIYKAVTEFIEWYNRNK